jgi:hypothetical protein
MEIYKEINLGGTRKWSTLIKAIDPNTGDLKLYSGPIITSISKAIAINWCYENCGYLEVSDEVVSIIPADEKYNPLWDKKQDFDNLN